MSAGGYQPHYRQIEQALRERISGLRPGERLPSDTELCVLFGVSRMTARNAMQRLEVDGLIRREPVLHGQFRRGRRKHVAVFIAQCPNERCFGPLDRMKPAQSGHRAFSDGAIFVLERFIKGRNRRG